MKVIDVFTPANAVRAELVIRKGNTKGKLGTRTIPIIQELRLLLETYSHPEHPYLFPSRHLNHPWKHMNPEAASHLFQKVCDRVRIIGASTHNLRRSALTQMSNAGIPLRIIQEISGHRNLEQLQKYLEVRPDQVRGAVSALSTLSYVRKISFLFFYYYAKPGLGKKVIVTNQEFLQIRSWIGIVTTEAATSMPKYHSS